MGGTARRPDVTHHRSALDDLLDDPLIQLVMKSDRVRPQDVRLVMEQARDRAQDMAIPPAHVIANSCCGGLCA
ncbi:MAG: hypothetical protein KF914_02730 [Rhizobiaceae bacterium]|nr:hypothetical protein [Rhizobiaceae bacterium]